MPRTGLLADHHPAVRIVSFAAIVLLLGAIAWLRIGTSDDGYPDIEDRTCVTEITLRPDGTSDTVPDDGCIVSIDGDQFLPDRTTTP